MARLLPRWHLGEFSLDGPSVDAEGFGGVGDVAAAVVQHVLDVLPLDASEAGVSLAAGLSEVFDLP